MSNIDKRALREAAEKALPAMQRLLMMPNDELFDEALPNVDGDVDAANAFNLLTGPETVLALLDELEAVQRTSAARLCAIDTTHKMFQRERDRAEAAEKRIALDVQIKARLCRESNSLHDRLREAEKRIAELERKEQHSERQSVIDALAASGEAWSDIEEYMQEWDAARSAAAGKGE